jgi:hypothetical protein
VARQWRGLANYTIPKVDVQVSGHPAVESNIAATNDPASNGASLAGNSSSHALVQPVLGRPLAGNAANVTVNLGVAWRRVPPNGSYTVDMRCDQDPALRPHPQ